MRPHFSSGPGHPTAAGPVGPGNGRRVDRPGIHGRPGSERVSARPLGPSSGPWSPSAPGARPPPLPPPALRPWALQSPAAQWALPPWIPSSRPQSALPLTVILLAPAPGWGLGAVPLLPPCVSAPSLHSAGTYFGSSLILLPVLSRQSASSPPPVGCSMLLVLCT